MGCRRAWFAGLAMVLVLVSRVGSQLDDHGSPLSCTDSRIACGHDSHCQMMLTALPRKCARPEVCEPKKHQQCRAIQTWLQYTPIFEQCHCNLNQAQTMECLHLKRSVFEDPCPQAIATPSPTSRYEDSGAGWYHVDVSSNKKRSKTDSDVDDYDDDFDDYDDDMDDDSEDLPKNHISCIGVRKNCLLDRHCRDTLTDFRRLCQENKKRGVCVSPDREGCFQTIEKLRPSAIFECQCHMKRYETRKKCDRIQDRLANNTCLVTVPYIIHSTKSLATSYDELLSIVSSTATPQPGKMISTWNQNGVPTESTCVPGFSGCNSDPTCRLKMAAYMSSCVWNTRTNRCNRELCLTSIQNFYLLVRPERTHALLFCQCIPGDYKCEAIRQGLYPTCSTVVTPPPSCHDIIANCEMDPDCRQRWHAYEDYCRYDKISGGCSAGPTMCRNAQVGIMGTILTTNCTCAYLEDDDLTRCVQAKRRLQHYNVCKEMALLDFNKQRTTTPKSVPLWKDTGVSTAERKDCLRHLGHRIPSYMNMPTFIRMYHNDSECSDLCHCNREGTMSCRRLPCPPSLSCKEKSIVYAHGSGFVRPDRGQCRCIKAEIVCARPKKLPYKQRTGLFLHIGYSVQDRYLLEGNSGMHFSPQEVAHKLGALLNGDTAEQFCKLSIYHDELGNIIYEVKLATYGRPDDIREMCESPAQLLSYMVNSRNPTIVTDAELSVLKVAEMEMLQRLSRPLKASESSFSLHHYPNCILIIIALVLSKADLHFQQRQS